MLVFRQWPIRRAAEASEVTDCVPTHGHLDNLAELISAHLGFEGQGIFDTDTLVLNGTNDRVGIGTLTPTNTLNVFGNINSTGYVNASDVCAGAVCLSSLGSGPWTNSSGNATRSSGNVGIGITDVVAATPFNINQSIERAYFGFSRAKHSRRSASTNSKNS